MGRGGGAEVAKEVSLAEAPAPPARHQTGPAAQGLRRGRIGALGCGAGTLAVAPESQLLCYPATNSTRSRSPMGIAMHNTGARLPAGAPFGPLFRVVPAHFMCDIHVRCNVLCGASGVCHAVGMGEFVLGFAVVLMPRWQGRRPWVASVSALRERSGRACALSRWQALVLCHVLSS